MESKDSKHIDRWGLSTQDTGHRAGTPVWDESMTRIGGSAGDVSRSSTRDIQGTRQTAVWRPGEWCSKRAVQPAPTWRSGASAGEVAQKNILGWWLGELYIVRIFIFFNRRDKLLTWKPLLKVKLIISIKGPTSASHDMSGGKGP